MASGVKLTGPYVPSPLTGTACGFEPVPVAGVLQSFFNRVKVIVPPAGAPVVVGLIAGVRGWFDVPLGAAVSGRGWPRTTSGPAVVGNAGVTGVTVKHSFRPLSLESGTPFVVEAKCADQQ